MTVGSITKWSLALGFAVLLGVALTFRYATNGAAKSGSVVKVQFAYPVTSLKPLDYKDWQSVFLGNHIYPRLTPQDRDPRLNYITKSIAFRC